MSKNDETIGEGKVEKERKESKNCVKRPLSNIKIGF